MSNTQPYDLPTVHQKLAQAVADGRHLHPAKRLVPKDARDVQAAVRDGALDLDTEIFVSLPHGGGTSVLPRTVLQPELGQHGEIVDTFHERTTPPLTEFAPHYSHDRYLAHRVFHFLAFGETASAASEFVRHNVTAHVVDDRDLIAAAQRHIGAASRPGGSLTPIRDGLYIGWFTPEQVRSPSLRRLIADLNTP